MNKFMILSKSFYNKMKLIWINDGEKSTYKYKFMLPYKTMEGDKIP